MSTPTSPLDRGDLGERAERLTEERDTLRRTLADLASADPFAAHAEADHAMAYERNADLTALRSRLTEMERVLREVTTCGAPRTDPTLGKGWFVERHAIDAARALLSQTPNEAKP